MKQMKPRRKLVTAEMLWAMPDNGVVKELVLGEVVEMAPAGLGHGWLGHDLSLVLGNWVKEHGLGRVATAETGFILRRDPDTVRAPDLAFIAKDRLPEGPVRGFGEVVPDLVAEVVSPSDRIGEVMAKVGDWLEAGVKVVWVLWPDERRITVFRGGADIELLGDTDNLTCPALLPGFAVPVAEVFG